MTSRSIQIACASDDRYAEPLAVALASALRRVRGGRGVQIIVVDTGISALSRMRLEQVAARARTGSTIEWIAFDATVFKALPTPPHISATSFARLMFPEILPAGLEKALYFDADLIALDDVSHLWDEPLCGMAALAVQDFGVRTLASSFGIPARARPQTDDHAPYFNSGVMVMDLDRWRTEQLGRKALEWCEHNPDTARFADQDGLNVALYGKIRALDLRWNILRQFFDFAHWRDCAFKERVGACRNDLLRNPGIMHFAGAAKPWNPADVTPMQYRWLAEWIRAGWLTPSPAARRLAVFLARNAVARLRRLTSSGCASARAGK